MTFSTGGQWVFTGGQTKLLELSFSIRKTFFYMVKPGGENLSGALPLMKPLTVCVCIRYIIILEIFLIACDWSKLAM